MKTKDEILLGMQKCSEFGGTCEGCPYRGEERVGEEDDIFSCGEAMMKDAAALIEAQAAELARLQGTEL